MSRRTRPTSRSRCRDAIQLVTGSAGARSPKPCDPCSQFEARDSTIESTLTSPHVSRQPGVWSARRSDGASEHLLVSQHARAPMSRLLANVVASRSRHRFAVPIAKDDQKLRRPGSVSVGGSADPSGQRNRSGLISSIGLRKANRLRGRSLSSAATQSRSAALCTDRSVPLGSTAGRRPCRHCYVPAPG